MRFARIILCAVPLVAAVNVPAQEWRRPYEKALRAAKQANWDETRAQFLEAIRHRPEDSDKPSVIGGSVADRKPWRDGAPYTPNFGVAYSSFKQAAITTDPKIRAGLLSDAITGLQALIDKGQVSIEAMLFLAAAYSANNDTKTASEIQERINQIDPAKAFKVDREMIEIGDLRVVQGASTGGATEVNPGSLLENPPVTAYGPVPILEHKFALLIGNAGANGKPFAENDADLLKDALVRHAGYADSNIVVLKNVTTQSMLDQAKALADKMPESGTVLIFFTGAGVYDPQAGRDYLLGTDTPDLSAYDKMVAKTALYQVFMNKGASIFAFFQVDRIKSRDGHYFGLEVPQVGRIAQCHGNSAGESCLGTLLDGKQQGVYATAMSQVLADMRTNRIPVSDFAWATFYKVRRGPAEGGGGAQTPTLPVVISMATSARF